MNVTSICYAPMCGHVVLGEARVCPRCGGRTHSPRAIRALGVTMAACGLVVTGVMLAVTWWATPLLQAPGTAMSGGRFAGDGAQAAFILQLFWLVIAFGVGAIAAGLWQLVTARRNRLVTGAILLLAGTVFFAARATELAIA